MNFIYILPWVGWFVWFIVFEAIGFRKGVDRWPTLSELVKGWEGWVHTPGDTHGPWRQNAFGIGNWTWRRWLIALGIPALATVLEFHWVFWRHFDGQT